jgi:hypothetical protein
MRDLKGSVATYRVRFPASLPVSSRFVESPMVKASRPPAVAKGE